MKHHPPHGRPAGVWDVNARAFPPTDPSAGLSDHAGFHADGLDDDEEDTSRKHTVVTERRAAARQRQIDIGKGRPEYVRYLTFVPKDRRTPTRPRTPDPGARVSKRQFDRQLSEWRRLLHEYDDPDAPAEDDPDLPAPRGTSGPSQALPQGLTPSAGLLSDYRRLPQTSAWPSMYGGGEVAREACSMSDASSSSGTSSSATATVLAPGPTRPALVEAPRLSLLGSYSTHANILFDGPEAISPNSVASPSWRFLAGRRLLAEAQRGQRVLPQRVLYDSGNTGSRLRASCREAAAALPGGFISDPSEPMKVFDFSGIESSEPITVIPSFDGTAPYVGRGGFECALDLNGHSKIAVDPEDCPVTL